MAARNTKQKSAIRNVIEQAERPLSPEEILHEAREIIPGLGQATVYRALNAMQAEQLIVPVDIPGHPSCFEKAGLKHHHHFACTSCGKVFELQGCSYAGDKGVPPGFHVEGHEVILYGQCRGCHNMLS